MRKKVDICSQLGSTNKIFPKWIEDTFTLVGDQGRIMKSSIKGSKGNKICGSIYNDIKIYTFTIDNSGQKLTLKKSQ